MSSFTAILAEIERRDPRVEAVASKPRIAPPVFFQPEQPPRAAAGRDLAAAYELAPAPLAPRQEERLDAARIGADIDRARKDARALRALRRRIARAAHPDRGGDAGAMAEFNARIDAALADLRRR